MRKGLTRSERRLWGWLRDRRVCGYKFRRQYPVARYILDFYCPQLKLAIEVDGRHYQTSWMAAYDSERARELHLHGIEVVRISNILLIRDPLLVEEIIRAEIARRIERRR